MRSIRALAVAAAMLVTLSGCGDDGSGTEPGGNQAPVADFEAPSCTVGVPCSFSSTSTDDAAVTEWSWDFDADGAEDANSASASFTYSTAMTYSVTLRVRDAEGLSHSRTRPVTAGPPGSGAPVADFTVEPCTATLPCQFTSTSSDDVAVTEWSWDFNGDGTADASTESAAFTYTAAGVFNVSLTVRDAAGLSNSKTTPVNVDPAPANTPPTAGFTYNCPGAVCTFTSTSSDAAPGSIVAYAWSFGDGGTSDVQNPLYTYAITLPRSFTVTLTVTDNEGATDVETQTVSVTPPVAGAEGCVTKQMSDQVAVDCALNVPVRSTMKLKLLDINCDLRKQRVVTPPPISDQVFLMVCSETEGRELGIFGGPLDELIVYEAGSQVVIRFVQGIPNNGEPPLGTPAATFTGTYPDWTINFEDGENPGAVGEPDFIDVVVGLHATVVP
jgi:PKD repeat protein